ncbi:MAG: hypothetical protein QOJ35_618 [Solirubrobacteraceae bacterium]|jgi:hypothetical protein|nr:hypothetical protein [Solirubrobacteraceae bacterium]
MLANRGELLAVLGADPRRLGRVFARHAYGMRRWVDLFSARVATTDDPDAKQLLAEIVAANARHMNLFRARARAHGIDPDAYVAPREGDAIYERIELIGDFEELVGYAAGSLDHFAQLLDAYAACCTGEDAAVIAIVAADNGDARARLATLATELHSAAGEAHELYRLRELVETGLYADAA